MRTNTNTTKKNIPRRVFVRERTALNSEYLSPSQTGQKNYNHRYFSRFLALLILIILLISTMEL